MPKEESLQQGKFPLNLLDPPTGKKWENTPSSDPAANEPAPKKKNILSVIKEATGEAIKEKHQEFFEGMRERVFNAGILGSIMRKTWEKARGNKDNNVSDMAVRTFGAIQQVAASTHQMSATLTRIDKVVTNISENVISIADTLRANTISMKDTLERMAASKEENDSEAGGMGALAPRTGDKGSAAEATGKSLGFSAISAALDNLPLLLKGALVAGAAAIGYAVGTELNKGISSVIKSLSGGAENGGEDTLGGILARIREVLSGDDKRIREGLPAAKLTGNDFEGQSNMPGDQIKPPRATQADVRRSERGEYHPHTATKPTPSATQPTSESPSQPATGKESVSGTGTDEDQKVIDFISKEEGYVQTPQLDPPGNDEGRYAIGYGHTITEQEKKDGIDIGGRRIPYTPGMTITKDEALALLKRDLPKYVDIVKKKLGTQKYEALAPEQKAALVSHAYNTGFVSDSVKNALDAGDMRGAADALTKGTNTIKGKGYSEGLAKRRRREGDLFASVDTGSKISDASNAITAAKEQQQTRQPTLMASVGGASEETPNGGPRRRGLPSPIASRGAAESFTRVGV